MIIRDERYECKDCINKNQCIYNRGKDLCPLEATCLVIPRVLLDNCNRLEVAAENSKNKYYHIVGSNCVIASIEDVFCVLVDYKIETYEDEKEHNLSKILSAINFRMIKNGKRYEVVCSNISRSKNISLGKVIKTLEYGEKIITMACDLGFWLDHKVELFDERCNNKEYNGNRSEKNHYVYVNIKNAVQLERFIEDVIDSEIKENGVYMDKESKQKDSRDRDFVKIKR